MKKCKTCEEVKELSEFYTQKYKRKDGTEAIAYKPDCKDCTKEKSMKWKKDPENRERFLSIKKKSNNQPNQRRNVKEAVKKQKTSGYFLRYQQENKEKMKQYRENRELNRKHEITKEEWEQCKVYFDYRCAYCGISEVEAKKKFGNSLHKEHVDHEGSNDITNCVPSCKGCNSSKWKYSFEEWYIEKNEVFSEERLNKINKWLKIVNVEIPI